METPSIILPRLKPREGIITRIAQVLASLDEERPWRVSIEEYKPTRSTLQNEALWGHIYPYILKHGGEAFGGWTKDDLHEAFLGEWSGWITMRTPLGTKKKPKRRSKRLNKQEFSDYMKCIQDTMARHGMFVPDPDPHWREHQEAA